MPPLKPSQHLLFLILLPNRDAFRNLTSLAANWSYYCLYALCSLVAGLFAPFTHIES